MNKKIAVMQPYLFPYIGYFQLINAVDKFILFDDVNYINKGRINRNFILNDSSPMLFTLPLKKPSQNKLINEIELSDSGSFSRKFLKSLKHSYVKAPYFEPVMKMLADIFNSERINLSDFIHYSLIIINEYLDIKSVIIPSSSIYENNSLKGSERIIDICKKEKADTYINLPGGTGLYSAEIFLENGISLKFIKSREIIYKQFKIDFIKNLSIIDVMMFNSKDKVKKCLNEIEYF